MGVYDRDYYRRSGPSYLGAFGLTGSACKWLIISNVVLFVLQIVTRTQRGDAGWVTDFLELDTSRVLHGEVWRLLSYAFLHDTSSIWHILLNMIFLWMFGKDIEEIYGTREFIGFYLTAAFLGGCAFVLWALAGFSWVLAGDVGFHCVGASGAVTAVMVIYACHFPRRIIYVFFVLPVPIWLFVLCLIALDANTLVSGVQTGTAVTVHLAGAAFGFAYYKAQWRITNLLPDVRAWMPTRSRPRLRVVRPEDDAPEPVPVGRAVSSDEQLEAKVDAVLEKVARSGQDSLSDSERQILLKASELYRRRRT